MAHSTTVRVRTSTHSALTERVRATGASADTVIAAGLRALELEDKRRQFEADARRLAEDPADRAELATALRDVAGE